MRKACQVALLVVALLLSQSSAFAWGATGHMVVAQIGYSRLNPTAAARVDHLVRLLRFQKFTYNHVTVATMMDDFRSSPAMNSFKPWHFFDKPFFDGIPPKDVPEPSKNVKERIEFVVNQLKTNPGTEANEAKLVAYLFHLVGDIHQPLHCTSRFSPETPHGDLGGNSFPIKGKKDNLHSYWDAAGGAFNFTDVPHPLTRTGWRQIRNFAFDAMTAYPDTNPEWKSLDVNGWVDESFTLAVSSAYDGIQMHTKPGDDYQARAQAVSRRRLAMAGYRLAALLNDIYPQR